MGQVITLSSHVAYGAVGNRIIVPALEALGICVTSVATLELPWHPGMNKAYGAATRIVPDEAAFATLLGNIAAAPWLGKIDAIVTGYLGAATQAPAIANLVTALKKANPGALYLCDPVIGDTGGLYVPETTACAIRDQLWPLADIVTPNLFEFNWIMGTTANTPNDVTKAALTLQKRHVIVTSLQTGENEIANLLMTNGKASLVSNTVLSPTPNGTGDMLAALFLGYLVKGFAASEALDHAAKAVFAAITYANAQMSPKLSPERLHDILALHFGKPTLGSTV